MIGSRDDNWRQFMERFVYSVQHIVGAQGAGTTLWPESRTLVDDELEILRAKVEELSDEVS
jgi:hypothetical protein